MLNNLVENSEIVRVENAVAAGVSTITPSAGVDTDDAEGVMFIIEFGAITAGAVTSVKIQQSADDSSYADLEGSSVSIDDDEDEQVIVIDIRRPTDRYVLPIISRATQNAVLEGITAIKYRLRKSPATQGATVADTLALAGPDEGTA